MEFIQNAKQGDNRWWKYLIGIAALIFSFVIGNGIMTGIFYYQKVKLNLSYEAFTEALTSLNHEALALSENAFYASLLISFLPPFIFVLFLLPKIHCRSKLSILSNRSKFDLGRFSIGVAIMFGLATISLGLILDESQYSFHFKWSAFIYLFFISIILVPLQVATEEIIFRGYLLQAIQQLTNRKWLSLLIITILFALLHVFNPEFKNGFWRIIPAYLILSFLFGLITIIDNGLELAIGLHTGNNLFVSLMLSTNDGSVQTPSIFKTNTNSLVEILPFLLIIISIGAFILLKLIYKWNTKRIKEALH